MPYIDEKYSNDPRIIVLTAIRDLLFEWHTIARTPFEIQYINDWVAELTGLENYYQNEIDNGKK